MFELNTNFNGFDEFEKEDQNITIWTRKVKKTINTYMSGWDIDKETLKGYHSSLKKKWGCNGSLKNNYLFNSEEKGIIFHLSRDCVDELVEFLKEKGIDEKNIEVKTL